MAQKRTVQLQAELQTDEDFEVFLMSKGLLVVEVYSDWCGPCLGILSTLRRIKLDVGDLLNLAIAKSDTISYLHRFCKRSEPIWLFINEGRAVNIMFGTDSPKLTRLIYEELQLLTKFYHRDKYSITELLPEEINRDRIKNEAKAAQLFKETHERQTKKSEYFKYVTDTIEENLPDIGVTIIGPHIHRDLYRKIIDYGVEKFGIQCKDRRNQPITKEQFEIINTACKNPLAEDVIDAMVGKDLFVCFWKIQDDGSKRKLCEVLEAFAEEITKPKILPPDEYRDTEEIQPPLISSIKIKVEYELPDDQECPHETDSEQEPEIPKDRKGQHDSPNEDIETNLEEYPSEMGTEEDEEPPDETKQKSRNTMAFDDIDIDSPDDVEEEDEPTEEGPKKNICKKNITIPGIWFPKDERTHAALIYVLFRNQTATFLPPDPVPEPPHLIMAFNTYKQRDLIDFAERYKDDVPLYGYFTSDDADEAKFIANSKQNYSRQVQSASDKLVFKVNKRTSHTMLSLVTYGPTYVSFNTEIGQKEARQFFPEDYVTSEQEMLQLAEETQQKTTKKTKGPASTSQNDSADVENVVTEEVDKQEDKLTNEENININELGDEKEVEVGDAGDTGEAAEISANETAPTAELPENTAERIPAPDAPAIDETPA